MERVSSSAGRAGSSGVAYPSFARGCDLYEGYQTGALMAILSSVFYALALRYVRIFGYPDVSLVRASSIFISPSTPRWFYTDLFVPRGRFLAKFVRTATASTGNALACHAAQFILRDVHPLVASDHPPAAGGGAGNPCAANVLLDRDVLR